MAEFPKHTDLGRILITGANGFVGAALCREFLARGWNVVAGVRRGANLSTLAELNLEYQYGDVTHPESLSELLAGIDTIIHNAGMVKAKRVSHLYAVNTSGTIALFERALELGQAKRFVLISSQAASGPSNNKPKEESDSESPITHYGRSKLQAEQALYKRRTEMNMQFVRPVGVYGPGDKEILTFFQTLNRGIRPYIGDRNRHIQLIHVHDLAQGIAELVEHDLPSGEVYTLAEERSYTFAELIDAIALAVGKRGIALPIPGWLLRCVSVFTGFGAKLFGVAPMLTPEKAGELLSDWRVSVQKARNHFDFDPKISFSDGARATVAWYKKCGWL